MVTLVTRDRGARERPKQTVHFAVIISLLLQCRLHVGNYLIGRQIVITVDRSVIRIIRVAGIVAPGRIPEPGVPVIPSPAEESNATVTLSPPIPVVPLGPVSPEGLVMLALPILTALNLIVRSELHTRARRIRFVCEVELTGLEPLRVCLATRHPTEWGGRDVALRLQPRVARRGDRVLRSITPAPACGGAAYGRFVASNRMLRRMTRRGNRMLRSITRWMARWGGCMLRTLRRVRRRGLFLWCWLVFFLRAWDDGRECKTAR